MTRIEFDAMLAGLFQKADIDIAAKAEEVIALVEKIGTILPQVIRVRMSHPGIMIAYPDFDDLVVMYDPTHISGVKASSFELSKHKYLLAHEIMHGASIDTPFTWSAAVGLKETLILRNLLPDIPEKVLQHHREKQMIDWLIENIDVDVALCHDADIANGFIAAHWGPYQEEKRLLKEGHSDLTITIEMLRRAVVADKLKDLPQHRTRRSWLIAFKSTYFAQANNPRLERAYRLLTTPSLSEDAREEITELLRVEFTNFTAT